MNSNLLSRRDALVLGGSAFLSHLLGNSAESSNTSMPRGVDDLRLQFDRNCKKLIWLWPDGGPSQIDTFDMKPNAPAGYRGPFRAELKSNGLLMSDQFPELGRLANRMTWIRSRVAHTTNHDPAINSVLFYQPNNGHNILSRIAEASRMRPAYGQTPDAFNFVEYRRSFGANRSDEMVWEAPRFSMPQVYNLIHGFSRPTQLQNAIQEPSFSSAQTQQYDEMVRRGHEVIRTGSRIVQETEADVRNYCGTEPENPIANGMLTISRLARANLHKVFIFRFGQWDTHWDLGPTIRRMAGPTDRGIAALVRDVIDGRFGDTLLVYGAEFGRHARFTPHMMGTSPGREHSFVSTNFMVASDERLLRRGVVWGSTDDVGGTVSQNPVSNEDWVRTIAEAIAPRQNAAVRRQLPGVFA